MAHLEVRDLDDAIVAALTARARRKGITLEDEARQTLVASVEVQREAYVKRLRAFHAAAGGAGTQGQRRALREEPEPWQEER